MGFTSKIVLRKNRIKNDGTYPLAIRITVAGKQSYVPIGQYLPESEWDDKNQRLRPTSKLIDNTSRFNNLLRKNHAKIDGICTRLLDKHLLSELTVREIGKFAKWGLNRSEDEIGDRLDLLIQGQPVDVLTSGAANDNRATDVYSYLEQCITQYEKSGRKGYAQSHEHLLSKLKAFHKGHTLKFEHINYAFLKKLEAKHIAEGHTYGGLGVYLRTLRARFNDAIKEGLVHEKHYPFDKYSIKKGSPKRHALSDLSFQKLLALDLSEYPAEHRARNFFLASYYLRGMNWMDLSQLTVSNLSEDWTRLFYQRRKTKKRYSIAIHPKLRAILAEYISEDAKPAEFIFPILSPEDPIDGYYEIIKEKRNTHNRLLGKIGMKIGAEDMTFYSARHTYAMRSKRKGVPTSAIQDALGHATEQTTQAYLESFEDEVIDTYDDMVFSDE